MSVNTRYRDSVFSFLFSDPDILRELYCALESVSLPHDIPVTINTLQDALFMDRINDISFEIGGKLVILIEHQSTINPNMALRLLMYIARVYEKIVGDKKIYTTGLIHIPRPEFFVLYNGTAPYPHTAVLKLSDAFESGLSMGLPEKELSALDLVVKVININQGMNEEIVRKSKTLTGYSTFIAKVREFEKKDGDKKEAMVKAVRYCRNHDILKEFLETNASEVMNMLITEWNIEDALEVRFEEGREEGREEMARNALAQGIPIESVHQFSGIDMETLKNLQEK